MTPSLFSPWQRWIGFPTWLCDSTAFKRDLISAAICRSSCLFTVCSDPVQISSRPLQLCIQLKSSFSVRFSSYHLSGVTRALPMSAWSIMLNVMDRGEGNYAAGVGHNSPHYQNATWHLQYCQSFTVRPRELKLLHQLMFTQRLCSKKPKVNYC